MRRSLVAAALLVACTGCSTLRATAVHKTATLPPSAASFVTVPTAGEVAPGEGYHLLVSAHGWGDRDLGTFVASGVLDTEQNCKGPGGLLVGPYGVSPCNNQPKPLYWVLDGKTVTLDIQASSHTEWSVYILAQGSGGSA